jgi:hypothetical protein
MNADIQVLHMAPDGKTAISGWMTIQTVENQPQNISNAMAQAKAQYPNYRIRAVHQDTGSMIDMLF